MSKYKIDKVFDQWSPTMGTIYKYEVYIVTGGISPFIDLATCRTYEEAKRVVEAGIVVRENLYTGNGLDL